MAARAKPLKHAPPIRANPAEDTPNGKLVNGKGELRNLTPGERLRRVRVLGGLSLRDVHDASTRLSKRLRNEDFVLLPRRLHKIEMCDVVPSLHHFYTLASAYGYPLTEFLSWYGIPQQGIPKSSGHLNAD